MEVAPFFVDFHHFLSIFTNFYQLSRFTHFCRDLHFVAIYALFPQIFFGQSSLPRNITRFLHVCWGCWPDSRYPLLLVNNSVSHAIVQRDKSLLTEAKTVRESPKFPMSCRTRWRPRRLSCQLRTAGRSCPTWYVVPCLIGSVNVPGYPLHTL